VSERVSKITGVVVSG